METEAAYKRCPNGHYYQEEECPYCLYETIKVYNISDNGCLTKVCRHISDV